MSFAAHPISVHTPQPWILVEQNPTGWQGRNPAARGVVWVAIVCRESLSSPETWPSGPVIQTSRGRTRKQFGEVLVVSRVAYHATCRKLIYVVSLMIEERLASALKIRILRRKQMPNNPKRQRDIWLNWGDEVNGVCKTAAADYNIPRITEAYPIISPRAVLSRFRE